MKNVTAAIFALSLAAPASATTLFTDMTVDNAFQLYVSTNDALPGALVGAGTDWQQTYSFMNALTPGMTNYLHVVAINQGGPGAFIGDFQLSDASFAFENGGQSLVTNPVDWKVSLAGFGGSYVTPLDQGPNGVGPWGSRPSIDGNAHFLWEPANCGSCTIYFSTTLTTLAVPEPQTYALLFAGLGLLGFAAQRRTRLRQA